MKVVLNKCYGGFSLSKQAYEMLGLKWDRFGYEYCNYGERTNPKLVRVVEALGDDASGELADLRVVEIPDDVEWEIDDYDGYEEVIAPRKVYG